MYSTYSFYVYGVSRERCAGTTLCTGGVSDRVDDDEIATVLLLAGDLGDMGRRLVRRARELGGWDDATAVLVRRAT